MLNININKSLIYKFNAKEQYIPYVDDSFDVLKKNDKKTRTNLQATILSK